MLKKTYKQTLFDFISSEEKSFFISNKIKKVIKRHPFSFTKIIVFKGNHDYKKISFYLPYFYSALACSARVGCSYGLFLRSNYGNAIHSTLIFYLFFFRQ